MNPKFSNFNFDKWLSHFIEILYLIDSRNKDFMEHETPSEIKKDKFFHQDHGNFDEYSEDLADSYLIDITKFNCFMKFLMAEDRTHKELFSYLVSLQFPSIKNSDHIYTVLSLQKSYRTSSGILFTPSIFSHIERLINFISNNDN